MKTTIDSAGRIVIPRPIRAAAGLEPGSAVEVELRHGVVSIEPAATDVRIEKRGRLRVAVAEVPTLTEDEVSRVREQLRTRR